MISKMTLEDYVDLILKHWNCELGVCEGCPHNRVDANPDFAFGDSDVSVMVVAQNPGGEEPLGRETGSAKVTSRDYFSNAIREAKEANYKWIRVLESMVEGTRFEDFSGLYWTNVVKCHPDSEGELDLKKGAARCSRYLPDEIALAGPRLIVAFGDLASAALIRILQLPVRYGKMEDIHGLLDRSEKHNLSVLFFYHWSWKDSKEYRQLINSRFADEVDSIWGKQRIGGLQ